LNAHLAAAASFLVCLSALIFSVLELLLLVQDVCNLLRADEAAALPISAVSSDERRFFEFD
jgi:hypothetical protein